MPHPWRYPRPQMSTSPQTCYLLPKSLFPPKPLISMITRYSPAKSTFPPLTPPKAHIFSPQRSVFLTKVFIYSPEHIIFPQRATFPKTCYWWIQWEGMRPPNAAEGQKNWGGQRKQCRIEGMLTQGRQRGRGRAERRAFAVPF